MRAGVGLGVVCGAAAQRCLVGGTLREYVQRRTGSAEGVCGGMVVLVATRHALYCCGLIALATQSIYFIYFVSLPW